jgi:hypothetical protein
MIPRHFKPVLACMSPTTRVSEKFGARAREGWGPSSTVLLRLQLPTERKGTPGASAPEAASYSSHVAARLPHKMPCSVSGIVSHLLRFTCKTKNCESGRCWVRTSNLCRVKAAP